MAKRVLHDVKQQKKVKLKRFFYFMRALLSARWILEKNSMPSVEFDYLLLNTDIELNNIEGIKRVD